jgi:hypothetical protein
MDRPIESNYNSHVAYTRALEAYCDTLAQPAQEPIADVRGLLAARLTCWHRLTGVESDELVALFQAQPVQPAQEPDELTIAYMSGLYDGKKKRPWVGLMDNEAIELAMKVIARLDLPSATKMQLEQQFIRALNDPNSLWMLFAAEIEAKLKEKNFD